MLTTSTFSISVCLYHLKYRLQCISASIWSDLSIIMNLSNQAVMHHLNVETIVDLFWFCFQVFFCSSLFFLSNLHHLDRLNLSLSNFSHCLIPIIHFLSLLFLYYPSSRLLLLPSYFWSHYFKPHSSFHCLLSNLVSFSTNYAFKIFSSQYRKVMRNLQACSYILHFITFQIHSITQSQPEVHLNLSHTVAISQEDQTTTIIRYTFWSFVLFRIFMMIMFSLLVCSICWSVMMSLG